MKFDNIIIGGGLSGLTCGIKLAEQGRKCAIVSSGQSAIHFFSGSFDLLGQVNGEEVSHPIEAIKNLADTHPYQRVGIENIGRLAEEAPQLLNRAGLKFCGKADQNHFVLTPMGVMKPSWLTLDDFTCFDQKHSFPWKKVLILNFSGFLDFHTLFVKDGLKKFEVDSQIKNIAMKAFEAIRKNPSEMRSTNIAKVFDKGDVLDEFVKKANLLSEGFEVIILPSVFGLFNKKVVDELKAKVNKPVVLVPAIPPSVPGIRSQMLLSRRFQELGGTFFMGDNVEEGYFENNRLMDIRTNNHGDIKLEADAFILASGSFYSKGIVATHDKLYEPIFGLDIDGDTDRSQWLDEKFFKDQPYMHFGVKADSNFRALMKGQAIENLYVAGSVLGGANALKEGSGAGISLLTSLHVVEQILK
ncbi:glycerol-3-phosphate dehydrogenase subunit GlpB [Ancylomarina euxinus]|uniref:Glycerol-3-phosphate dehydrogenase subunit GlpB n=1 Tax=Ancylomarina euxinus TaxID=2283627 RepID=A0A425Y5N3_9BACT|nr:glycerol-3-phosphate dehydrogenase subunit GlpB [Ancylomarina euxinus]MCZ4694389.1 glycerol-3-phosphate dehydrogenase subunit GlpB [Ancylomarina euxinus]MUP14281.1 glycerol-3-phosphate dehydrogenase subunit GlpB [Ancylomarina euxinus]RRG23599.1 glycerol-3-phosphate dehydrogenase subunit GlpB [Ancylomarina euxinus]